MKNENIMKDYSYHIVVFVDICCALAIIYGDEIFDGIDYFMRTYQCVWR